MSTNKENKDFLVHVKEKLKEFLPSTSFLPTPADKWQEQNCSPTMFPFNLLSLILAKGTTITKDHVIKLIDIMDNVLDPFKAYYIYLYFTNKEPIRNFPLLLQMNKYSNCLTNLNRSIIELAGAFYDIDHSVSQKRKQSLTGIPYPVNILIKADIGMSRAFFCTEKDIEHVYSKYVASFVNNPHPNLDIEVVRLIYKEHLTEDSIVLQKKCPELSRDEIGTAKSRVLSSIKRYFEVEDNILNDSGKTKLDLLKSSLTSKLSTENLKYLPSPPIAIQICDKKTNKPISILSKFYDRLDVIDISENKKVFKIGDIEIVPTTAHIISYPASLYIVIGYTVQSDNESLPINDRVLGISYDNILLVSGVKLLLASNNMQILTEVLSYCRKHNRYIPEGLLEIHSTASTKSAKRAIDKYVALKLNKEYSGYKVNISEGIKASMKGKNETTEIFDTSENQQDESSVSTQDVIPDQDERDTEKYFTNVNLDITPVSAAIIGNDSNTKEAYVEKQNHQLSFSELDVLSQQGSTSENVTEDDIAVGSIDTTKPVDSTPVNPQRMEALFWATYHEDGLNALLSSCYTDSIVKTLELIEDCGIFAFKDGTIVDSKAFIKTLECFVKASTTEFTRVKPEEIFLFKQVYKSLSEKS